MGIVRRLALLALLCTSAGCRGTYPAKNEDPSLGVSAILVRGRVLLPTGETQSGKLLLNLESEGERYRVRFPPKETTLYIVEPGVYRLYPTRNIFGGPQDKLKIVVNGRSYRVAFPRDILRRDPIAIKPGKIASIGALEAKLVPNAGKPGFKIEVTLDDGIETRRQLVQDMISRMMDPDAAPSQRENAVTWTRALEQALVQIQGSNETKPAFKPSE